jgi:hypothetical protein
LGALQRRVSAALSNDRASSGLHLLAGNSQVERTWAHTIALGAAFWKRGSPPFEDIEEQYRRMAEIPEKMQKAK